MVNKITKNKYYSFIKLFLVITILIFPVISFADTPNLIPNFSVETQSNISGIPQSWQKGGTGANTRVLTYPVAGYDGVKAVKTDITSYTNGDAKWYFANIPVTPGETYNFSDNFISSTLSHVTLRYTLADGTFKYPDLQKNIPISNEWTSFSKNFVIPTNFNSPVNSLTVFHLINSIGSLTTDNFSFKYVDTHAPVVSINSIPSGISGQFEFNVSSTDDIGVTSIDYILDQTNIGSSLNSPSFGLLFDTTTLTDGSHTLKAVAHDEAGNIGYSDQIIFTTLNNIPAPSAQIIVTNIIINDNNGTKTLVDFPLFIDNSNVSSGELNIVPPGSYIISEITDPNYTRTISGDCDANGYVDVINNDIKNCIITNDDIPDAPSVVIPNLIPNFSVETQSNISGIPQSWQKGGTGANTRVLTYPVAGYDGVKAVKTDITSYTNGDAKWYFAPIPASSGNTYVFSDYYISTVTSYVTMQYKLADGTFKYVDIGMNIAPKNTWTKFSTSFTVPVYAQPVVAMTVFHLIKNVGSVTVDNYSITAFLPPAIDPNNSILNGTLETASYPGASMPYGWNYVFSSGIEATPTYPVAGYQSNKAVKIDVTSYTSGAGAKWYFANVPVVPGEEYRFSNHYKSTSDTYVTAGFKMSNGTYKYADLARLVPSQDWKYFSDTFLIPPDVVSVTVFHIIKNVGLLTTDGFSLEKLTNGAFATGMVTLNFDDGLKSVFENARPILNNYNIKSSHYIVTDELDDPYYMTQAQFLILNSEGNEIGAHTKTHAHLTQLSDIDAMDEIAGSKQALANMGATPNSVFVYPYGEYNDKIKEMVINSGFIGARTVHTGYNTKNSDKFALRDQHVEVNTTVAQIKSYIDYAMLTKTWLILELHDTNNLGDQYSNTPQTLEEVASYIAQQNIPVVTTAQGISLMNN